MPSVQKRPMHAAAAHHNAVMEAAAVGKGAVEQDTKVLGHDKVKDLVLSFDDVCHLMNSGDGMWYAGYQLHSIAIEVTTLSTVSHGGLLQRVTPAPRDVKIVDIIEGTGGRNLWFYDEIAAHPGKYIWAAVNKTAWPEFDGEQAIKNALKYVNTPYGNAAICCQIATRVYGAQLAMWYFQDRVDNWMRGRQPFCSMGQTIWCAEGDQENEGIGGVNPVPGRDPWLVAPQDTFQSMLWMPDKYSMIP